MAIPDTAALGDSGHVADHNSISSTLTDHAATLTTISADYVPEATATATYAQIPEASPRPVFIRAQDFIAGAGAPTLNMVATRWAGWSMWNAASPRINTTIAFPRGTVVDIDILWSNLSTNAGDVRWRLYRGAKSVSDTPATVVEVGAVTATAKLQYELDRTRIVSSLDLEDDMVTLLMLDRLGSDAADTLVGDAAVVGMIVTPVDTRNSIVTDDGAWCWFNEPRALAHQGSGQVYTTYVTSQGDACIAALDVGAGTVSEFTLKAGLEIDDHATPSVLRLADGTLMAFYSTHSVTDDPIYFRKSTNPDDVTAWDAEVEITLPAFAQPCYPRPALIGTRIYVFYRNILDCDYIYSDDGGATWSTTDGLVDYSPGWRGYINIVASDGRVDFISGDDNPNESSNTSLYHFYFDGTNLCKTDGTVINAIGTAITTAQMTKIYDYTTDGDAWGWDLQLDSNGRPRVVFATFPTAANHHYYYAYWNGSAWVVNSITYAGATIADRGNEVNYSGGIALLSSDTNTVYLSRVVGDQFEIEKWVTADDGATWTSTTVTTRSRDKQFRPTTPENHYVGAPECFWLSGWYVDFYNYQTRVVYPTA